MSKGAKRPVRWILLGAAAVALLAVVLLLTRPSGKPDTVPENLYEFGLILQENQEGLYVMAVGENSPAEYLGICPGDVILELNGTQVSDSAQFERFARGSGETGMQITLLRNEERLSVEVKPAGRENGADAGA